MSKARFEELLSPDRFDAVLFDLDGVITATARVHAAAWKELFDSYLHKVAERTGEPFREFEVATDYRLYVDGKPRYEGVRSFLESRGIELSYGDPEDPPDRETVCGLGNRKNVFFNEYLRTEGPEVFPATIESPSSLRARTRTPFSRWQRSRTCSTRSSMGMTPRSSSWSASRHLIRTWRRLRV
jgi:alpha,alpha-trehalase